jgi:nuclear pore complex protein Nup62
MTRYVIYCPDTHDPSANNQQLTKVVRVLNSQLSQLQLIDSGASQLQEKIQKAQKESQRIGANGWNGLGTDPADDFYRSFRGGRTDRFGGVS